MYEEGGVAGNSSGEVNVDKGGVGQVMQGFIDHGKEF